MYDIKDPRELVTRLEACGVTVSVAGETIQLRPGSRVPGELVAELRQHKGAVIAYLRQADAESTRQSTVVVAVAESVGRPLTDDDASPYARGLVRQVRSWAGESVERWRRVHTAFLSTYSPDWQGLNDHDHLVAWAGACLGLAQARRDLARLEASQRGLSAREWDMVHARKADISFWQRVANRYDPSIAGALTRDVVAARLLRHVLQAKARRGGSGSD